MRRSALLAVAATAVGAVGARRAADRTFAGWAANPDPTGGRPMAGPPGRLVEVTSGDGTTLRGIDAGEANGPAVLLIHGFSGNVGHFAPVAQRLVDAGHRVVSVDQRGHGRSTLGADGFTMRAIAGDVRAWLEGLDLRDAVVAGHSMGGLAVQSFALEHPDVLAARVRSLVLVATLATFPSPGGLYDRLNAVAVRSGLLPRVVRRDRIGRFALRGVTGARPVLSHIDAARETFLATPARSQREAVEMMRGVDIRDRLATIRARTAVIVGTDDRLTECSWNEEIARLIPGASIEVVPGAGHMLPWEHPDRVTDLVVQASKP